jgi:hypothetical protein
MPYGYGSANTGRSSSSSSGGGWSPGVQHSGMPTKQTTTTTGGEWSPGVGGQQHIPKTKTKVQTGGGWTPGAGGIPNWATKFNINKPQGPTTWNKWRQHVLMSGLLKEQLKKDYHQTAAHDFTQRFNLPDWASKGLATGYQYTSELGKMFDPRNLLNVQSKTNPAGIYGVTGALTNVLGKAGEEARLNTIGIEGLTTPQLERYQDFLGTAPYLNEGGLAYLLYGGLV